MRTTYDDVLHVWRRTAYWQAVQRARRLDKRHRENNTRDPKYIATDQNSESTKHGKWSIKVILPLANRRIILQFFNP